MPVKLDLIDQAIIQLLQEDGRMPVTEIARRVTDATEKMIRYRIGRLTREGIIKIGAVLNAEAIGYQVTADVWLEVESGQATKVAECLKIFEEVRYIAFSTGDYDISIQVVAFNNMDLYRIVSETISTIPGVKRATMLIVPVVVRDVHQWDLPGSLVSR